MQSSEYEGRSLLNWRLLGSMLIVIATACGNDTSLQSEDAPRTFSAEVMAQEMIPDGSSQIPNGRPEAAVTPRRSRPIDRGQLSAAAARATREAGFILSEEEVAIAGEAKAAKIP